MIAEAARGEAGEIRRPLSPMERWYWICDQISPLNVIARVHVAGSFTPQDVAWAAARLADEHPLLRVAVAAGPDGSRPRFVAAPDPRIPVRSVRGHGPAADRWEREVNDVELVTPLDWRGGPLARIVDVAQDAAGTHDLILTVSHVVADASAALELLRRLVELTAARAVTAPAALRPRAPLPPPEALLPSRINGVPRGVHLVAWLLAGQISAARARPARLARAEPVPPGQRRTRLIRRELDAAQLDTLVARCRREQVTVHSALAAAMALAVAGAVGAGRRRRTATVAIGSPVDFRAELVPPVGHQDAGAYVAAVPLYVPVGPAVDLWAAARSASRDLRRSKRFRHHLALVAMLRFMCPPSVGRSARAVALIDRVVPDTCLSNVGRHDFPGRIGPWQLSGAQFVSGISLNGYLTATVTSCHGALHWNFTYIEGAVTRDHAERIANRAVRILVSGLGPDQVEPLDSRLEEMPGSTTTRG